MHCGDDIPCVTSGATLSHTLVEMSQKRLGLSAVVDNTNRLLGVFTDGDLRRALDDTAIDLRTAVIDTLMTHDAKRSEEHTSALQSLMRISYAVFCFKKKTILYFN